MTVQWYDAIRGAIQQAREACPARVFTSLDPQQSSNLSLRPNCGRRFFADQIACKHLSATERLSFIVSGPGNSWERAQDRHMGDVRSPACGMKSRMEVLSTCRYSITRSGVRWEPRD